jgi:hypothetical protein
VAAAAVLPHLLKRLIDQERPDRSVVHGRRHGIPRSGKPYDAFPSGHAVHVGAVASAVSWARPRWAPVAWGAGSLGCCNADRSVGALDVGRPRRPDDRCSRRTLSSAAIPTPRPGGGAGPPIRTASACRSSLSLGGVAAPPLQAWPLPMEGVRGER